MKKSHQFIVIGITILFAVIAGVCVIFYNGSRMLNSHYVRLEVNPKVEFLTNSDNIVDSVYPVNQDAYDLIIGEQFVGLPISEAVTKFLTLCAKAGYIAVDGKDNAVGLAVSSGFTQKFENEIYTTINNYYKDNLILGVIAEADSDLANFKEKKEKNTPLLNAIILGIINIIKIPIKITYDILDSILALFFNGLACLSKLLIPEEEQDNNNIKIFKEEYKEIKDEKGTKQ